MKNCEEIKQVNNYFFIYRKYFKRKKQPLQIQFLKETVQLY